MLQRYSNSLDSFVRMMCFGGWKMYWGLAFQNVLLSSTVQCPELQMSHLSLSAPREAFCSPIKCMQGKKDPDAKAKPTMYQWGWLSLRGSPMPAPVQLNSNTWVYNRATLLFTSMPVSTLFWHCPCVTHSSWIPHMSTCWHTKLGIYWPNSHTIFVWVPVSEEISL